jgi:hypothetical protein
MHCIPNFIGITTLHVSGSLSAHHQEFLDYIGFGTFYAVLTVSARQEFISSVGFIHKEHEKKFV